MPETAKLTEDPRKSKPLPDTRGAVGDNGPTDEDLLFFAGQMKQADEKIKEARDGRKKLRQAAKLRGVGLKTLDHVMALADEQDETELDRLRELQRYARAFKLPLGWQFDLFDAPEQASKGAEALIEKARHSGYEKGVMGLNPDEQAYPPMTEEGQAHMAGWHDGQKVNHDKLLKLNEDVAAAEAAEAAKVEKKRKKKGAAAEADGDGKFDEATKH